MNQVTAFVDASHTHGSDKCEQRQLRMLTVTLAKMLCDNCDNVESEQRSVFDLPDPFLNPRVSHRDLPGINPELWKERVSCGVGKTDIDIGAAERISPCVMCTCTKEGN
ncbi:uncharacterized protein LOC126995636 [Eriocheir sinensis]|uniref:uncharacterized protein LOC126995636 n=1 Tax=Eriocheir sinensis TaxID=95602 RepID=UPI0021C9436B|nr:uncharacterized protein LOC126995636 [Eriocheir sinensis]